MPLYIVPAANDGQVALRVSAIREATRVYVAELACLGVSKSAAEGKVAGLEHAVEVMCSAINNLADDKQMEAATDHLK